MLIVGHHLKEIGGLPQRRKIVRPCPGVACRVRQLGRNAQYELGIDRVQLGGQVGHKAAICSAVCRVQAFEIQIDASHALRACQRHDVLQRRGAIGHQRRVADIWVEARCTVIGDTGV